LLNALDGSDIPPTPLLPLKHMEHRFSTNYDPIPFIMTVAGVAQEQTGCGGDDTSALAKYTVSTILQLR